MLKCPNNAKMFKFQKFKGYTVILKVHLKMVVKLDWDITVNEILMMFGKSLIKFFSTYSIDNICIKNYVLDATIWQQTYW